MENIKCNCGNDIPKLYQNKAVKNVAIEYPIVWLWTCEKCGQVFTERVKPIIRLEDR